MSYIKFEARHLDDDRWLDLSPSAFVVHTWALSYCNEQATDGHISRARAARLVCPVAPAEIAEAWEQLTSAGLWAAVDDGYCCDTFTAHGLTAEEQDETRAKWAEDKRRQRMHRAGNHSICTSRSCLVARGQEDRSKPESGESPPETSGRSDQTRPDPTRPFGEGRGKGQGGGASASAGAADETPLIGQKHHHGPICCDLSDYPNNRHHWQPDECSGCDDPLHAGDVIPGRGAA